MFAATLIVGVFKPKFFIHAGFIGRVAVITLFSVGVIHLIGRFREALERYAYFDDEIHESILDSDEPAAVRRFSRVSATAFLLVGTAAFFGLGILIGNYTSVLWVPHPSSIFQMINPEGFFYPPIFVMCVDFVHGFVIRGEN